eukprot:2783382-Amphidinium_carterae.1
MRSVGEQLAKRRVTSQVGTHGMGSTSSPANALLVRQQEESGQQQEVPKMAVLSPQRMGLRIWEAPRFR